MKCYYNVSRLGEDNVRTKVILANTSFMGGRNTFIPIAYIVVGFISLGIGIVFLVIHRRIGKKQM